MKSIKVIAPLFLFALGLSALFLSRPKPQDENAQMTLLRDVMSELQSEAGVRKYHGLYESLCASCHGHQLEGNALVGGPSLNAERFKNPHAVAEIADRIYRGGMKMPSFANTLTQKQVVGLSLWLISTIRQMGPGSNAPSASSSAFVLRGKIQVKGEIPSEATLFLFGKKNPTMQGPPLLVKRLSAAKEVSFELTERDVMAGAPPQAGDTIYLQAKVDVDGNPMTQDGSKSEPLEITISPNVAPLKIVIP